MPTDNRTLALNIHVSTEVAREQLKAFVGTLGGTAVEVDAKLSDIEGKFASMGRGISAGSAIVAGAVGGFVSGLVQTLPSALIAAAGHAMDYAASIGEVSQQLGISAEFLQEFRFAATQSGATTEQADEAMKQFSVTVGKAADGNKRATAAFKAIGVEIADSNGKLRPSEELYRATADAISKIEDPARRVADATNIFHESGSKILPVLEAGSKGFNDFAAAARSLGLVISNEMIGKLDGLADKTAALGQVITTQMAVAIADNADAIIALGNAAAGAVGQVGRFLHEVRGLAVLNSVKGFSPSSFTMEQAGTPAGEKAVREGEIRNLQQELRTRKASNDPNSIFSLGRPVKELEAELARQRKALADFLASPEYQAAANAGVVPAVGHAGGDVTPPAEKAPKSKKDAKDKDKPTLAQMIGDMPKVGLAFDDTNASIDKMFGKLDGTGRTIEEMVGSAKAFGDTLEKLYIPPLVDDEQQQRINDFGLKLSQNIGQALIYGQKLGPALVNSLKAAAAEYLTSKLFDALTGGKDHSDGGGLLGAIVSGAKSLFGGAYADGGDPPVGQWSLVGERGPELIKPRSSMTVIPNGQFGRGGGRNAPAQNVNVSVDVNPSPLFVVAARAVASEAGASAAVGALRGISDTGIGRQ